MAIWDELTAEQYSVMVIALEATYLNNVIYYYNFHVNRGRPGHEVVAPAISSQTVRSLIPRFAEVTADLIERGWVELREPYSGVWEDVPPMIAEQIAEVLVDAKAWIWDEDGDNRMVLIGSTDRFGALLQAQSR